MRPWRVLPQIGKLKVQCQEDSIFLLGCRRDFSIGPAQKPLLSCGCHIMTKRGKKRPQMTGQILIELELHLAEETFQMLSRESSAP